MKLLQSLVLAKSIVCLLYANPALAQNSILWKPLNEPGTGGRIDSIAVSPYDRNHLLVGGDILGTRISTDQGNSWSATSGWINYEISDFTWHPQDPNVVWAGSLSGPHISIDGGQTWTVKRTGFPPISDGKYTAPVEKILFDPDSPNILAFGGDHRQIRPEQDVLNYGSVWVSANNGDRWRLLSRIEGGNIMAASYAGQSPNRIYALVWRHGFFFSQDDGATWVKRSSGLPQNENGDILVSSLAVHPEDSEVAWVTVEKFGVYKTTNGGNDWKLLNQGIPSDKTVFWSLAVEQDGKTLYAGNRNYNHQPGVYKSTDGGETWQQKFCDVNQIDIKDKPYPGGINPWWIAADPVASGVVYTGTDNAVYRSVDGGETWSVLTARLTPQGWQGTGFSGLVAWNVEWNPYNSSHIIVQGMDEAKAIQSWDGGNHWRVSNPGLPPYEGGHDVAFAPNWIFTGLGQDGSTAELIAQSNDSGRSWTLLQAPVSRSEAKHIHVDPAAPDRLWVVMDQQLWYSDNATQTTSPRWTQLKVGSEENKVGDIEAIPGDGDAFYIATDNGIYYTANGTEFTSIGGLKDAENVELAIAPSEPGILYAAQDKSYWEDYGLWRYNATQKNWSVVWNDRSITSRIGALAVHPQDPNILAIITNDFPYHDRTWATGVWLSRDAGKTWRQENQGLPMLRGDAIAFHPDGRSIVVGLGGAGFYVANFENNPEGIAVNDPAVNDPAVNYLNYQNQTVASRSDLWQRWRCKIRQELISLLSELGMR